MPDPSARRDDAPAQRWTLARKQALLTAIATLTTSALVGGAIYLASAAALQTDIERRFRSLANERQRYAATLVRQQYERIGQLALWPELRTAIDDAEGPAVPDRSREAGRLLREASLAVEQVLRIDVIDSGGTVLASSIASRVGEPFGTEEFLRDVETARGQRSHLSPPVYRQALGRTVLYAAAPLGGGTIGDSSAPLVVATVAGDEFLAVLQGAPFGQSGRIFILPVAPPGDEEPLPESGLERQSSVLGERLVYWQPFGFNPGETVRRRFVVSVDAAEAYAPLTRLRQLLLSIGGLLTLLITLLSYIAARGLGRRLSRLTVAAEEMAHEGRPEPIAIRSDDEVGTLTRAFNTMGQRVAESMDALREDADRQRADRDRLIAELQVAQEIQACLYPTAPLAHAGYEVDGRSLAADQLCGDYYDYFLSDDGRHLLFATGDVSGHGVGPSLLMVEVRGILRNTDWSRRSLPDAMAQLNRILVESSPEGRFVTLLLGRLDCDTGQVEYVGAGHRGALLPLGGPPREMDSTGLVLGLATAFEYESATVTLGPGDRICVASDGIEETIGSDGRCLGWPAVLDVLGGAGELPLRDQIDAVLVAADTHAEGCDPADDRTILVLRREA